MSAGADIQQILIDGHWRASTGAGTFQACNPMTGSQLPPLFPVSSWHDCEHALDAAQEAFCSLSQVSDRQLAEFLERYATAIEREAEAIVARAHLESALPISPRLRDAELPRTVNQMRQGAAAAREGSWRLPTIDAAANIRSYLAAIGPVCVIGPSNFPLAFGSVSGGDFVAAIAAGNPVIAKAHPLHPETARLLAALALEAVASAGLPPATVQLIYHVQPEDGLRLVADHRLAATAFTGSHPSGLRLKHAAEGAGRLIYLELSSLNPVVILPGALAERSTEIADEFSNSALMGGGQFCTNPGLVILMEGAETDAFIGEVAERFRGRPAAQLMSGGIVASLKESIAALQIAGAVPIVQGGSADGCGFTHPNTLLRVTAEAFLQHPAKLQTEAFGSASLLVVARSESEAASVLAALEGNLTGCIYSAHSGADEAAYRTLAAVLRPRVGRLLNDRMPTGVNVSPAMNHGGPYPATGHPHFTAVGIPASMRRFSMLQCFDGVRQHRLPPLLRDDNPNRAWRLVDGAWTQADLGR